MTLHLENDEARRTAALALWRYGHDYLRAAQALCEHNHVACRESQVPYHMAAQGVEFALKAFLRVAGVPSDELSRRIGHSLLDAMHEALARGLPAPPVDVTRAIQSIAPYHRNDQFHYLEAEDDEFPDLTPLLAAGTWILDQTADSAVIDYYVHHGHGTPETQRAMLGRLRADLELTRSKIPLRS